MMKYDNLRFELATCLSSGRNASSTENISNTYGGDSYNTCLGTTIAISHIANELLNTY